MMNKRNFEPILGSVYYYVHADDYDSYFNVRDSIWDGRDVDFCRMRRGVCHMSYTSAAEHCDMINRTCDL